MKKAISVLLCLITIFGTFSVMTIPASAESTTAFDILTSTKYAKTYTLSTSGITKPYTGKNLKTRGSVTYGNSSSAYIDNINDELYILDVGINSKGTYWAKVSYPIGSKRAVAYIPLTTLTLNNASHEKTTASGKFYCAYRKGVSTSSSYYVAKGDTVYLVAKENNNYQIMYPTNSGIWRLAWCSKSDYNKYCTSQSNNSTKYTLSYNANGGSGAPASQSVKANSNFYLSSTKPTRSGYTFLGWSTNKNATSASYSAGAGVRINSNITLYAIWNKNSVNPSSINLNLTSYTMNIGNTKQLSATIYPTNATDKSVTWSSSNTAVVSVSANGLMTAQKAGTATITAKTSNGKTSTCTITVRGLYLDSEYIYDTLITVGDIVYMKVTAYPADTKKFTWSSSNNNVISVNSKGKVTAKSEGTATITVKTSDGRKDTFTYTVKAANKWITGNFDNGTTALNYTTIKLNRNKGDAKIVITTYNLLGHKANAKIHVTLRDCNGNWIWEGDVDSGKTLKLANDHSEYRVYIAKDPNNVGDTSFYSYNNSDYCAWSINAKTNCYISS